MIYTIDEIAERVRPVAEKYGIPRVYLFGSYARGDATEESDVDLLVDAENIRGLFMLGGLYDDLCIALEKELDMVTIESLYQNPNSIHKSRFIQEVELDRRQII